MRLQPLFLRPAALAATFFLLGASAHAQQLPAPPPAPLTPLAGPAGPAGPESAASTRVASGRVQQYLLNPNGEVDGLLLADGTQVSFPPHLGERVQQILKPGDNVQVTGWRAANAPVVRAASIAAGGRRVEDTPPDVGRTAPPPREQGALTAMSASGKVGRVLYTDRGDVNGVLLDSGTIVRFAPQAGNALAPSLQRGHTVYARGWGSRTAQGSALEATAIGSSAEGMRELFAGPAGEPPPPRGPRDPGAPDLRRAAPPAS